MNLKKPTFLDLESATGQISSRSYYKFASYNVHASPKGINFRLGLIDQGEALLAGMSNVGFFDPAKNAAFSLVKLNASLMEGRWDFDTFVILQILLNLRDAVPDAFHLVQAEIEKRADLQYD